MRRMSAAMSTSQTRRLPRTPCDGGTASQEARIVFGPSIVTENDASTLPPDRLQTGLEGPQHLLTLSSVEDDGLGEGLNVIWELEPGAQVSETVALPEPTGFHPPVRRRGWRRR